MTAHTAISASYHGTVNDLQEAGCEILSPFDRQEWADLLVEAGATPIMVSAIADDATASMALMQGDGRLEPLRNWYNFTWRHSAPKNAAGKAALTALARNLRGQSHRVTLWPVPDEDGSATALEHAFKAAGWNIHREQCDHNHVLKVAGRTFAEYWAQRPGRMRTTLKRKAKKVDVTIHTHFDAAAWAEYEAVYENSWKPEEGDPALLRRFAEAEGAAGRIRLAVAYYKGQAVAAQFWTVENATAYIHKLAHLEDFKNLSAGTTLSAALFEQAINIDAVEMVDFGTGNDLYKRDWMEEDRPRYRLDCLDPRQPRAWPALTKRLIRRLVAPLAPEASQS